jgi:hypothetical protein
MVYYSQEDEIKNLHNLKREMFNLIVRERDVKNPGQEIEAAKAYAQLARLQAELRGMLRPPRVAGDDKSSPRPGSP